MGSGLAPVRGNGGRSRSRGVHKISKSQRGGARNVVKTAHARYEELRAALCAHVGAGEAAEMGINAPTLPPKSLVKGLPKSASGIYCSAGMSGADVSGKEQADHDAYMAWARLQGLRGEAKHCLRRVVNEAHSHGQEAWICLRRAAAAHALGIPEAFEGARARLRDLASGLPTAEGRSERTEQWLQLTKVWRSSWAFQSWE